jgi:YVTN family beta-propeller protein
MSMKTRAVCCGVAALIGLTGGRAPAQSPAAPAPRTAVGGTSAPAAAPGSAAPAQTGTSAGRGTPPAPPAPKPPVRSVVDPGAIPTRQAITPAGIQMVFQGKVYGVTFGSSADTVYAVAAGSGGSLVFQLDWRANKTVQIVRAGVAPGMQPIAFDAKSGMPVIAGVAAVRPPAAAPAAGSSSAPSTQAPPQTPGQNPPQAAQPANRAATPAAPLPPAQQIVRLVGIRGGTANVEAADLGRTTVGSLTLIDGGARALVALTFSNELAIVDRATGASTKVKTGIAPFSVIANAAQTEAYVSNWGGRFATGKDLTSATGNAKTADRIVVDKRGIAASGTIARVDLKTNQVTRAIEVGLHPSGMALDETAHLLYVANSNSDSVSVVDLNTNTAVAAITIQPFARKVAGVSPESLAITRDGRRLYVACSGLNAVAVVSLGRAANRIEGLIPTGWLPNHLALSPDERYLAVSTLLGVGAGSREGQAANRREVRASRGTVHVIPVPNPAQLANYTTAVVENNRMVPKGSAAATAGTVVAASTARPLAVPLRAGDPSPIDHIVYIIKENRSYDQYFGDLSHGNGDASLLLVGEDVIPNHRKLAREFVLFDNFYANGEVSANGHQWVTQSGETDYTWWPGYNGRSYPKSGEDPLAFVHSGFLWDNALLHKRTFQNFGELVGVLPDVKRAKLLDEYKDGAQFTDSFHTVAPIAALNPYVAKDFPAYSLEVPDVVRSRIFLRHLKGWETAGAMPNLVLMHLPSDHTSGATAGYSTPKACFADNDLALGQVVEALTHSKFWKKMLIVVVEDDAQAGPDHVDGHRTVALAMSPYIKRQSVDSTFYAQTSINKTIELILGLPSMTLFDLIANDMRASFQEEPDYTPYTAETPKQSIYELNPKLTALTGRARRAAEEAARMNFREPDQAPWDRLNRMIWASVRGWDTPYPILKQGAFLPSAPDGDDDDDDH